MQTIGWRGSASFLNGGSNGVSLLNGEIPQFDDLANLLTDPPLGSTLQTAQLPTDALVSVLQH